MNRKPPSFPFYAKDWKSSVTVRMMTPTQRGYYIQLLCEAWDSSEPGFIPNGAPIWWLAGAASEQEFSTASELVLSNFKRDNRGRYYNERLLHERDRQLRWREFCSQGGKKSSETKRIHLQDKFSSTVSVEPTCMQTAKSKLQTAKSKADDTPKLFVKPSREEVLDYMTQLQIKDPASLAENFINHYESNGWRVGRNPMKKWQAAVRTWKSNQNQYGGSQDNGKTKLQQRNAEVFSRALAGPDR